MAAPMLQLLLAAAVGATAAVTAAAAGGGLPLLPPAARQLVTRIAAGEVVPRPPPDRFALAVGDVVGAARGSDDDDHASAHYAVTPAFSYQLRERVPLGGRHATAGVSGGGGGGDGPVTSTDVSDRLAGDDGAITGDGGGGGAGDAAAATDGSGSGHGRYRPAEAVGRGAYGEVWRAVRLDAHGAPLPGSYVLKRLLPHRLRAQLSGWREVHFGALPALRGHPHVARFVEHFTRRPTAAAAAAGGGGSGANDDTHDAAAATELWLVFVDEGVSLSKLLYTAVAPTTASESGGGAAAAAAGIATLQPSPLWGRLHGQPAAGRVFLRSLARQLLAGLAAVHAAGGLHRDVKPGNVLLAAGADGSLAVRLADFGSAVDGWAAQHLYPGGGPSRDEATLAYAPPEVRLWAGDEDQDGRLAAGPPPPPYDAAHPHSYDAFSLGVTLAETVLGAPASELLAPPPSASLALLRQRRAARAAAAARAARSSGAAAAGAAPPAAENGSGAVADGKDDGAALRHALALAGLARLCIAPPAVAVPADVPWEAVASAATGHQHHHHHNTHAGDSGSHGDGAAGANNGNVTRCDLAGFRRLWRRAERWARRRAAAQSRAARAAASGADKAVVATRLGADDGATAAAMVATTHAAADVAVAVVAPDGALPLATTVAAAHAPGEGARAPRVPLLPPPLLAERLRAVAAAFDASHAAAMALLPLPPAAAVDTAVVPRAVAAAEDTTLASPPPPAQLPTCAYVGPEQSCPRTAPDGADDDATAAPDDDSGDAGDDDDDDDGVPSPLLGADGEELLWRLLAWEPAARPTAADALASPFLTAGAPPAWGE